MDKPVSLYVGMGASIKIKRGDDCPCCGEKAAVVCHTYNGGEGWSVECSKCGALFDED